MTLLQLIEDLQQYADDADIVFKDQNGALLTISSYASVKEPMADGETLEIHLTTSDQTETENEE